VPCYFREGWVVPSLNNTAVFFVGGSGADALAKLNSSQLAANLQSFLGNFVSPLPNITNIFISNWTNDANVLGGYSYASVGTRTSTFNALRSVLNVGAKNIWFIGEATHPYDYSYAYGAYETGVDAATAALKI